jgi:hypothetical protein
MMSLPSWNDCQGQLTPVLAPLRHDHLVACSQFTGIVQNNADAITTDLAVAFQFDLPYLTRDWSTTSFIVDIVAVLCT